MKLKLFLCTLLAIGVFPLSAGLQLVQVVPGNNSQNVLITSKIVLVFSEDVVLGEGTCQLNGVTMQPTSVVSKYATFVPSGLEYSTPYTFQIAADAFRSKSGGQSLAGQEIAFVTEDAPKPQPKVYDAVVSADGSGQYASVQSAIDAAPTGRTTPWLIFIKKGRYNEHIVVPESKPHIHLIGQDRDETVIHLSLNVGAAPTDGSNPAYWASSVHNPSSPVYGKDGSMVNVYASDFYADNLTFDNDWGVQSKAGPQALAMRSNADRAIFYRCNFRSYQDTWMTPTSSDKYRHYVKNCFIEGAVDYIYAGGECYFDSCHINTVRNSGGYIVAPAHSREAKYGYVFMNCTLDAPSQTYVYLGRPWHNNPKTSFINTRLTKNLNIYPTGWIQTMGGLPDIFAEYNTRNYLGDTVDLSKRNNYYYVIDRATGLKTGECYAKHIHTAEEAAERTVRNVLSGSDHWMPDVLTQLLDAPIVQSNGAGLLSWDADPYAISYAIFSNDQVIGFTTEPQYTVGQDGLFYVKAINASGSMSMPSNTVDSRVVHLADPNVETMQCQYVSGNIQLSNLLPNTQVHLFNAQGSLLYSNRLSGDASIATQQTGCLLLQMVQGGKSITHKIIAE
ncbi:MAG TPA: pectinesterase family protein [Bacteroidales bacterium]|nr:pectinesterase family protein [Bacteroidales bacterium]